MPSGAAHLLSIITLNLPLAQALVAMSITTGRSRSEGNAMAKGLVLMRPSLAPKGATMREKPPLEVSTIPTISASAAITA